MSGIPEYTRPRAVVAPGALPCERSEARLKGKKAAGDNQRRGRYQVLNEDRKKYEANNTVYRSKRRGIYVNGRN